MSKLVTDNRRQSAKKLAFVLVCVGLTVFSAEALATGNLDLGKMASNITHTFTQVAKLLTAGSYIAGIAFSIGALMKFKQHKDNPQSVPIGTPVSLIFIAAALLFLPSVLSTTGQTLFGTDATTSGPTGSLPSINK